MKVIEIDNASGAWQLAPGVGQTLCAGVIVTLDTGFSEALVEIDAAAHQGRPVAVGGRQLIDVGPWAVGEALTVGDQRFVLLAARQAYVPSALGRASSEERLAQLGLALPVTSSLAASPFVQPVRSSMPPKAPHWRRLAIGALAAACVMIAVAAKVTNAKDDVAATPEPQPVAVAIAPAVPAVAPATAVLPAPATLRKVTPVAESPAPSPVQAAKAAPRQVKRPVIPSRPALSQTERQQLAAQIDSAALIGGFDPARAKQELQKIRARVAQDSELRRRLERELGRL